MAKFRTASGLVDVSPMIRTANGLVPCTVVTYTESGPVTGGGNMQASVSPDTADGAIYRKVTATATTSFVMASATGGQTPYAYAWVVDDAGWKITSQSAANTAFQSPTMPAGGSQATLARCIITDANGQTATTPDVMVTAENNYEGN